MKCKICGASCRCKNAGAGICCSCHRHKARSLTPAVRAMRPADIPPEWLPEIERIRAREAEDLAGSTQMRLFSGDDN